ncbi:DUF6514 family protein [Candidatus Epulonipiscium viviparus]|uniref:DUF6514 family protein n=1 Tax=Candidatus Epulonipiscium viviparus TaxID=420336 RepID=UPI00016C0C69|nr:DUF6514 family protein [Candidatus Epulopiscium viviparus]
MYEKVMIGEQIIDGRKHTYYLLEKNLTYGIEIAAEDYEKYICSQVYFTENKMFANQLCNKICQGTVTVIGLEDVIDDIVA